MYLGVSPVQAYQTIANMYLFLGDREGAIRSLQKALEEVDNPYLRSRLAQLQQTYPLQNQPRR
jgi:Tfp pilus assembly protein FimV